MDYEPKEIKEKIYRYLELEKKLKGTPIEKLESSDKYKEFLDIGYSLSNLVLEGDKIVEIMEEGYIKVEEELENRLKFAEMTIGSIERLIRGKEGKIIKNIQSIIDKY